MTGDAPSVGLIGLGGIGGAYAAQALDNHCRLSVICDPGRKARYEAATFKVNGSPYQFHFVDSQSGAGVLDLILVAVKFHQLEAAIDSLRPFVGRQTIIVSLLNGITSEELLAAAIPSTNVVHAVVVGTDGQKNGYEFSYSHKGKIVLGVLPSTRRQLLERTVSILKTTGIHFETPPDMEYALWWKFMVNVGINHTAAILRAPYRHFQTEGPAREIARAGMREVIQIANRKGINLTESDIDKLFDILATFSGDNKVSMLQDIEAGRTTEVEILAGEVLRLGRQLGIDTPVSHFYYHAIRHLEQN